MYWVIDRFEGDVAVLAGDDGTVRHAARCALPDDVREGDMLCEDNGAYAHKQAETASRRAYVDNLLDDLFR